MFGRFLFTRRARHTPKTPSSQFQLGPTDSKSSSFVLKLQRLTRPFSRPHSQEKNASQSNLQPPQGFQPSARPSQGFSAMTQGDHTNFDQQHGPYPSQSAILSLSPPLQTEEKCLTTSTPSTIPRPTCPIPNSPLMALPQMLDTTPTISSSSTSSTLESSQQTTESLAENEKIEEMEAIGIASRHLGHANDVQGVRDGLRTDIDPRVAAFTDQCDSLEEAIKRAEEHLAKRIEVRSRMETLRDKKREQRLKIEQALLTTKREHEEKTEQCAEVKMEIMRFILLTKKRMFRARGIGPRPGDSDSETGAGADADAGADSEDDYGVPTPIASSRSLKKLEYVGHCSEKAGARGALLFAADSSDWHKQGFLVGTAHQKPVTQGSDLTEFELGGEVIKARPGARTLRSSRRRVVLNNLAPQTEDLDDDSSDGYGDELA